ncbi:MAG: PIG-L family deacetylase [Patescibacteria group bacterium]|jgi:LmbE family N-acetylglucosaminyl deacetylase
MKSDVVKQIIDEQKPCYFISPHLDDVVLSASALIFQLRKHVSITVVNVFTQADKPPYTFSAKSYLRQCGYNDAEKLFQDRIKEDQSVLENLADSVINLNFIDAQWRKRTNQNRLQHSLSSLLPELIHTYPTYRFHIRKPIISTEDASMITQIKERLKAIVKNGAVFCPLAIGSHIDHIIVRSVCEDLFYKPVFWADCPYMKNKKITIQVKNMTSFTISQDLTLKQELVSGYETQYKAMFGSNALVFLPETYFVTDAST